MRTELVRSLGVSQPVVSDYKIDVTERSGETVTQRARILGVSIDEILGLTKPGRTPTVIKNQRIYRQPLSIDRLLKRDRQALARTINSSLGKAS